MSNKKQTAVEWLMPKILELNLQLSLRRISQRNCELEILRLFEQAKEMDKQQKIDAYNQGRHNGQVNWGVGNDITAEQYYKETYGETN